MSHRKVHFSVPIHQIEYLDKQWETASRLARDGSDWLRMGVDRQRFRDRIERTAEILNRILDFEFRQQIYQERFENFVIPEQQQKEKITTNEKSIKINETLKLAEPATDSLQQQQDQSSSKVPQSNNNINKSSDNNHNRQKGRRRRQRRSRGGNNNHRRHRGGHRRN